MKKFVILVLLIFFALPVFSNTNENRGYAGTPPGFYDDIDPASLDKDDEDSFEIKRENQNIHEYSDDNSSFEIPSETKATKNYAEIYSNLEPASHSYIHGIDPDEFYDEKDAAWSVYPLLRLNSPIYFKSAAIEPGYYLLTPREHKGKWYILFKQNGKVVHIIPVYDRDYTPETFYDEHIPKPKLTKSQKIHMGALNIIGKTKGSKRKEPIKSFLEVNDLDNYFLNIIIYYGGHKYYTIFRTIRL